MNPVKWMAGLIKNGRNLSRATPAGSTRLAPAAPKSCVMQGIVYPHGAEIRQGAMIRRCADGQWQEQVNPFITVGP